MKIILSLAGLVLLTFLSSCSRSHFLLPAATGSYKQEYKSNLNSASLKETTVPTNLSASVSNTPEISVAEAVVPSLALNKPELKPTKIIDPATLKPDTLKAETETKTQTTKKPAKTKPLQDLPKTKNQWVALLLVFMVGTLGIHRFYLGHKTSGALQLAITLLNLLILLIVGNISLIGLLLLSISYIWFIIDLILVITGELKPYKAEYKVKI